MTHLLRLLSRSVFPAFVVLACGAPAFASTTVAMDVPSSYGSYLAGQQALQDLSTSDAARYFHDATASEWNNPAVVQRAFMAYLADGDIDRAVSTANHLLDLAPDYTLAKLVVATSELKDRRYRAAAKELDGIAGDDFAAIGSTLLSAWAKVGDNRRADAFAGLDKIGKQGLQDFFTFHRALMADVSGDSADAITLAGKAYEANSAAPRSVEAYARMLGNAGRFDDALAVLNKFYDQGLGDPMVDVVRDAIKNHQRPGLFATSVQGGAANMYHGIAVLLASDGNADLALSMLQLGLYLDPHNDVIPLLIGQLLDNANQHAAANGFYQNIPSASPVRLIANIRIAQNFEAMGNRTEAIRELSNIATTNPTDLDALLALALLQRIDKQYDAAAATYSKAIAIDNGARAADWQLFYQRGISYERGNHWDQAQPDFSRRWRSIPTSRRCSTISLYLGR